MGGKSSKQETRYGDFNQQDRDAILSIFNELSSLKPKSHQRKTIGKKAIQNIFPENIVFGLKLYHWMKALNNNKPITFDSYLSSIEILIREPLEYMNTTYAFRSKDKLQIFGYISLEKFSIASEELSKIALNYSQGQVLLNELLNMFYYPIIPEKPKDLPGKYVLDDIFRTQDDIVELRSFVILIKKQLPFIGRYLKIYFISKFLDRKVSIKLPSLSAPSSLINSWNLPLLFLSNQAVQNVSQLQFLYSTTKSGSSFNRLAYAIRGYNAPTLILIKHIEEVNNENYDSYEKESSKSNDNTKIKTYLFGGFRKSMWTDELGYNGDSESYIFSLSPVLRNMFTHNTEGGTNYCYMNTRKIAGSKFKVGLGFGGVGYRNYRLWIDDDIESESYTNPDDKTYEKGYLVNPSTEKLKIVQVEIWGMGDENTLKGQEEFRAMEQTQVENSRKVDRKQFGQSEFDRQILFGNTFASANNKEDR